MALRDIKVGEEITVDYDYDPEDTSKKQWTKDLIILTTIIMNTEKSMCLN